MSFIQRLAHLGSRLQWMSRLTSAPHQAVRLVLAIRRDPMALQAMDSRLGRIHFRGADEQALKEVLVDQEYAFLEGALAGAAAPKVLDVGAHIGTFAIWLSGVNPYAQILSVEADPRTYEVAQRNARLLQPDQGGWEVIHAAAGARDGQIVRLLDEGPAMGHRIDSTGSVAVETASLTSLIDRALGADGRIDILKVDIEGSEEAFLCAEPKALERVERVVIELHPLLCDCDRVRAVLSSHYDTITDIKARTSSKPLLYCRRGGERAE